MTDSDLNPFGVEVEGDIENCIPDVPDVQGAVDKAIATAKGKVADLDFRPVDFNLDFSKFFTFDMFGKLLGKPSGLGYDLCEHCGDSGGGMGAVIGGSPFPDGALDWTDGVTDNLNSLQDQVTDNAQGIANNANNINNIEIPEIPGETFSIDSAISILQAQIDSVSDAFDSAGI